jgi:hypothetical protein
MIWDLHESDERDRGAIIAELKAQLLKHLLMIPGRAAFIVDGAVTVTEDELGARTLGDLIRRGRHFGLRSTCSSSAWPTVRPHFASGVRDGQHWTSLWTWTRT